MIVIYIQLNRTSIHKQVEQRSITTSLQPFDISHARNRTDATRCLVAPPQTNRVCSLAGAQIHRFGELCLRRALRDTAGEDHCANASRYRPRRDLPTPRRAIAQTVATAGARTPPA